MCELYKPSDIAEKEIVINWAGEYHHLDHKKSRTKIKSFPLQAVPAVWSSKHITGKGLS